MITSKYILDVLELLLDGDDWKAAKLQIPFLSDTKYEYTNGGGGVLAFHIQQKSLSIEFLKMTLFSRG